MHLSKSNQQKLFKAGHFAKGLVYGLMGCFALATVLGLAASPSGPKEVIRWIGENPFGKFMLAIMAVGLLSYCFWRWYKAVADTENEGHDKMGLTKRIAWFISGTSYGVIAIYTISRLLTGSGSEGSKQRMIDDLLQVGWGQIAIGLLGVIMIGVGIYQAYRGITEKFLEDMPIGNWEKRKKKVYTTAGKIGHFARLVVYGIIGFFLVRTAILSDAGEFKGIEASLDYVQDAPLGALLLALVGAGLLAYGFFMFIKARYKRI